MRRRRIRKTIHSSELKPEVVKAWLKLKDGSAVLHEGQQWQLMGTNKQDHFNAGISTSTSYKFKLVR